MAERARSAVLAAGVHVLALLLALATWHSATPLAVPKGAALVRMSMTRAAPAQARPAAKAPAQRPPTPVQSAASPAPITPVPITPAQAMPVAAPPRPALVPLPAPAPPAGGEHGEPAPAPAAPGSASPAARQETAATVENAPARPQRESEAGQTGTAAPSNTYAQQVFRHIMRVKEFPAHLARTGMAGRVLVRFAITPGGQAIGIAIVRSSGEPALDALALTQIRAAMPFPRPPRQIEGAVVQFVVPMTYRPAS